jgi:hypothetical protein
LKAIVNGEEILIEGKDPVVEKSESGKLHISWPLKSIDGNLVLDINEQGITMQMEKGNTLKWFLDLTASSGAELPFEIVDSGRVDCRFKEMEYSVSAAKGTFSQPGEGIIFRITPENNSIILDFSRNISR